MINFEGKPVGVSHYQISNKLKRLIENEGYELLELNCIFLSDEELLKINKEHLNHDYYTDIITFDLSDTQEQIEADLYISVDRTEENAHKLNIPPLLELERVIIHGVLHLTGYNDKTEEEQKLIRQKEDEYLNLQP